MRYPVYIKLSFVTEERATYPTVLGGRSPRDAFGVEAEYLKNSIHHPDNGHLDWAAACTPVASGRTRKWVIACA